MVMKKTWLLSVMVGMASCVFAFGTAVVSGEEKTPLTAPDKEIVIEGKKPAKFNHASHSALNISCGSCHHDASRQPLSQDAIASMPEGDQLHCASCHTEGGAAEKFTKRKDIFHKTCLECHKTTEGDKKGPTKCSGCHLKKKKKKALEGC